MNLVNCTNAIGVPLMYDRGPEGYGVPVPDVEFKGTDDLRKVLGKVGEDLKEIGWLEYMESMLTAGLYVNKKGAHGDGLAIDIDGVVLKPNPMWETELDCPDYRHVLVYKNLRIDELYNQYNKMPMAPRIKARLACLLSLRFGVVITAGYNKAHEDHIHADLSRPVKWYGSRSQVTLIQETINAFYGTELVVDGKWGTKTEVAWNLNVMGIKITTSAWLHFLKRIAMTALEQERDDWKQKYETLNSAALLQVRAFTALQTSLTDCKRVLGECVEPYIELIIDSKEFKLCENCFEVTRLNVSCKDCKMRELKVALVEARKLLEVE